MGRSENRQRARIERGFAREDGYRQALDREAQRRVERALMLGRNGITERDLQEAYERGKTDGIRESTKASWIIYAGLCRALHRLHGFGAKRLVRIMELANSIMIEDFTSEDAVENAYRETKVRFQPDDPFKPVDYA